MAPIRKGDGTPLEIPGVSEVRSGDGRVFFEGDAIPDSGLLLDDFANSPTVGSSGITDRKDFTELEYQEPEPEESEFGPVESRQEWTLELDDGSHDVDDERLQLDGEVCLATELDESVSDIRLICEFENISEDWRGAGLAESGFHGGNPIGTLDDGYFFRVTAAGALQIRRTDDNTAIIDESWSVDSDPHVIEMVIDGDEIVLLFDGSEEGSVTDTNFRNLEFAGVGNSRRTTDINYIEVI